MMPTSLDGVSVILSGKSAYVSYINASQLNILTPPDLGTGTVQVQVSRLPSVGRHAHALRIDKPPAMPRTTSHTVAMLRIVSFLDNLENNLKALESRDERNAETLAREAEAREVARLAAREIAPHAEALRNGPFKDSLLTACREIGHRRRTLVRPVWVDSTLRLEAGPKRLELRPTRSGVIGVFFEGGAERESMPIDLSSDPVKVAQKWLQPEGS
jgi:hypothetical protein